MSERNENNCQTCGWKLGFNGKGWCYWWFTEPEPGEHCNYDKL